MGTLDHKSPGPSNRMNILTPFGAVLVFVVFVVHKPTVYSSVTTTSTSFGARHNMAADGTIITSLGALLGRWLGDVRCL